MISFALSNFIRGNMILPEVQEKLKRDKQKPLNFDTLVNDLRGLITDFPDCRTGNNTTYSMENIGLGAFSVFYSQNPSFLAHQKAMQKNNGQNNARTLFGIDKIPCDNHIRNQLDPVSAKYLFPLFDSAVKRLNYWGHLDSFRSYTKNLLLALDGTRYYVSKKVHCKNCSVKEHKNGTKTYFHTVITPVFVAPGNDKVISLAPEFITPQDGQKKQDCENAACKRWLNEYAPRYKHLGITVLGDDLYCKHPVCSLILEHELDFILVCKPDSHQTLYQWLEGLEARGAIETVVEKRWTGKGYEIDTYRFVNQVPLRDGDDALMVNWCELTTTSSTGKVIYKNAFATNFTISKNNVKEIVADGRARWKIENENNNILKKRGYHFEHNFGHGKENLSSVLLTFNLLAFLFHTIFELNNNLYKRIRDNLASRTTFFEDVRALTKYMCFESWDSLLIFMAKGLELEILDTS